MRRYAPGPPLVLHCLGLTHTESGAGFELMNAADHYIVSLGREPRHP